MAQIGMIRLVPVGKSEILTSESNQYEGYLIGNGCEHQNWMSINVIPGGHEHESQAVDELHPSQGVHPHEHQHSV